MGRVTLQSGMLPLDECDLP